MAQPFFVAFPAAFPLVNPSALKATFLDVNPRAITFSRFNATVNGLQQRCQFLESSVVDAQLEPFYQVEVILANPPFVPNPDGTASAAGRCDILEMVQ